MVDELKVPGVGGGGVLANQLAGCGRHGCPRWEIRHETMDGGSYYSGETAIDAAFLNCHKAVAKVRENIMIMTLKQCNEEERSGWGQNEPPTNPL